MTYVSDQERLEAEVERWRTSHNALLERSVRVDLPDKVIEHIVMQYNLVYEDLSEDGYDGGMSRPEKQQRSCIAVRAVMRHYFLTGNLVHWKDAPRRAAS